MARRQLGIVLLGLLGLAVLTWPAQAAETSGFGIGLRGGAVLAHTDLTGKIGPGGALFLRHGITPKFALELSGGYGQMATEDSLWFRYDLTPAQRTAKETFTTNMGLAELRLLFTPFLREQWVPYLYAGGGVDYFKVADLTTRRGTSSGKGSTGMIPLGLGLRYVLGERWAMEGTFGYTFTFSDKIDELDEGQYKDHFGKAGSKDNFFTATLGIVYQIPGGAAEKPAERAVAPPPPPPPPQDTDGDGLSDQDEKTVYFTNPMLADTDSDGLSDGDEVKKYRTSPSKFDTDGGGIDDGTEVKRGTNPLVADDDLPKAPAKVEEKAIPKAEPKPAPQVEKAIAFPVVYFEFGGTILSPKATADLKAAAQTLAANPEIKLELRGHTDNMGTPEVNKRLSVQRAEVVKAFLVKQGIAASRLSTKGLADSQPAVSNATVEGRQKNRRTELIPVK